MREDDPSLIFSGDLEAWRGDIGQNSTAESIVSAIGPVYSLLVVLGIVEHLAIDSVHGFIDGDCFVEADVEGIVKNRRGDCEGEPNESKQDYANLHFDEQ